MSKNYRIVQNTFCLQSHDNFFQAVQIRGFPCIFPVKDSHSSQFLPIDGIDHLPCQGVLFHRGLYFPVDPQLSFYISDILYAEADGKRAKIHTKKGVIDASMSMADLEEVLPANEFCRPIRWALVSMREIVAMPTDILKLSDKTEIPISRLKRKEIQDAFANYSWRSTRRRMRGGIL